MPFPAGVGTCIVTGTYLDGQGNPVAGSIIFYFPGFELIDATDHIIISPSSITAVLVNGAFSVALPYTDNTAVNPSGWSYQVEERLLGGAPGRAYFIQLPRSTGSTVDISTLVPASGSSTPVWANAPFIPLSDVTTKGDLLPATAAGAVARLGVGADGTVLSADHTQPGGMGWSTPNFAGPAGGVLNGNYPNPGANSAVAGASAVGDTASAGTANSLALSDHRHAREAYAGPGASAVGDTTAAGTATTNARSDHRHGRETFAAPTAQTTYGQASAAGTATTLPRADHTHGTPSQTHRAALALGLITEPFPMQCCNHFDLGLSGGFMIAMLVRPGQATITNLGLWLVTAGSTSTGVNQMGLYSEAGALLASTGDMSAALSNAANNNTYLEAALGSSVNTTEATNYYIAVLSHMSVNAVIAGMLGSSETVIAVKGHYPAVEVSGQASLPANFTPSAAILAPACYWMAAS